METCASPFETVGELHALIQELGDGLGGLDQQLLSDLRGVAVEHEMRREAILRELQVLGESIGFLLCAEA